MKTLINIFSLGSVFFHEMAHIIALVITGVGVHKIIINKLDKCDFEVIIAPYGILTKRKTFIVAFAPVVVIIIFAILSIFSKIGLVLFIYTLLNMRFGRALPSKTDIETFKKFKKIDYDEFFSTI